MEQILKRVDYPDFAHPVASDVAEGRIMELLFAGGRRCNDC
jgi:hypothetical protein